MTARPLDAREARLVSEADFFRGLTEDGLAEVIASARKLVVKQGQFLFRQDTPADAVFLVLSGRVRLLQTSTEGQQVALRMHGPGELIALISALGQSSYPVGAQAQQSCVIARWSGEALWKVMERQPALAVGALKLALKRLHELQEQYRELATERVERRIARALIRLVRQAGMRVEGGVRIDMPLTRQDLAELSGTTLFTVSRVLTAWGEQGLLESKRGQVTVLRPHALVAIAEDLPSR